MMRLLSKDLVCEQAVLLVTDYLDGVLSRRQSRRFELHLRGCPNCRSYFEQIKVTIALSGHVNPAALSEEARSDLIDLFHRYQGDTD